MCVTVLVSAFCVMFILRTKKIFKRVLNSQSNTFVFLFKSYMFRSSYQPYSS
jgi:hypothetical protein